MAKSRAEYQREYRKRHPEKIKEMRRRWMENNQEKEKEIRRDFRKRNRGKINQYNREYYGKTEDSVNKKAPWTEDEIDAVLAHSVSDMELSKKIGRSVMAIQVKRSRLRAEGEKVAK